MLWGLKCFFNLIFGSRLKEHIWKILKAIMGRLTKWFSCLPSKKRKRDESEHSLGKKPDQKRTRKFVDPERNLYPKNLQTEFRKLSLTVVDETLYGQNSAYNEILDCVPNDHKKQSDVEVEDYKQHTTETYKINDELRLKHKSPVSIVQNKSSQRSHFNQRPGGINEVNSGHETQKKVEGKDNYQSGNHYSENVVYYQSLAQPCKISSDDKRKSKPIHYTQNKSNDQGSGKTCSEKKEFITQTKTEETYYDQNATYGQCLEETDLLSRNLKTQTDTERTRCDQNATYSQGPEKSDMLNKQLKTQTNTEGTHYDQNVTYGQDHEETGLLLEMDKLNTQIKIEETNYQQNEANDELKTQMGTHVDHYEQNGKNDQGHGEICVLDKELKTQAKLSGNDPNPENDRDVEECNEKWDAIKTQDKVNENISHKNAKNNQNSAEIDRKSNAEDTVHDAYEVKTLKKIHEIMKKSEEFERKIMSLEDEIDSGQFYYIDENLIRNIEKLDRIDSKGNKRIEEELKNVIKYIYRTIEKLEEKANIG